jgi:hypothetical protein
MTPNGESNEENGEEQGDTDDEANMVQVNFRVSETQREDWKGYAEENGVDYPTFSHFLRKAAQHEVEGRSPTETPRIDSVEAEPSEEVLNKLDGISNQLASVEQRLSMLEENEIGDEEIAELANDIWGILPESELEITLDLKNKGELDEFEAPDVDPDGYTLECSGSVQDIANTLNEDEADVDMAITRLKNDTHSIKEAQRMGETHYYIDR